MSEQSLEEIMAARESEPAETTAPEQITDAERAADPFGAAKRERDQNGRFAKADKEDPTDTEHPDDESGKQPENPDVSAERKPGKVPQQALEAERKKRQERDSENEALRRELAELRGMVSALRPQAATQPSEAQAPVFWENPDSAVDHRVRNALDPVSQQMQHMKIEFSKRMALQEHGQEAVQEALRSVAELQRSDPGAYQRLDALATQSFDPVGEVVRWHKQQHALREIGDDPAAYRERLKQELLAELQGADPRQQPASAASPNLPTQFAGAHSGGPRGGGGGYGGPRPLSEIMPRG